MEQKMMENDLLAEIDDYAAKLCEKENSEESIPPVVVASLEPYSVAIIESDRVKKGHAIRYNTTGDTYIVHPESSEEFRVRMVELKKEERKMSRSERRSVERKLNSYLDQVQASQKKIEDSEVENLRRSIFTA